MTEAVRIETCAIHGLRYNAAAADGCARCVRESAAADAAAPAAHAATAQHKPVGPQAALAAGLIVLSGLLFFAVHSTLVASFQRLFAMPGQSSLIDSDSSDTQYDIQHDIQNDGSELREFLLFVESPIFELSREQDPVLDSMVSELEDPEQREGMTEDEIQEKIEATYERLWGGGSF